MAGGKWTTWREMAQDVLDRVLGDGTTTCNTLDIVLHGGEGYSKSLSIQLIQKYGLTPDVAEVCVDIFLMGFLFCIHALSIALCACICFNVQHPRIPIRLLISWNSI